MFNDILESSLYGEVHKNTIKLSNFKMSIKEIDLFGIPAIQYKWTDDKGSLVAKFTTFKWWDGKNIENLKVYAGYRKNGLSYQLLDYAVHELNCKCLAVDKDNEIAKHVYDKYGFKVVAQDKNKYYMQINLQQLSQHGNK